MSIATKAGELRERALAYWIGRTEQERKFLAVGAIVVVLALLYLVLLAPALEGREQLRRSLPELRQQAAQLQTLAGQAQALAGQPAVEAPPLTRDALAASMTARGLKPESLTITGEYARVQLNGVSFANLIAWLEASRRDSRLTVQDAQFTAQTALGQVDATLTLRQNNSPAS
jgi:general secretion pathway protein M